MNLNSHEQDSSGKNSEIKLKIELKSLNTTPNHPTTQMDCSNSKSVSNDGDCLRKRKLSNAEENTCKVQRKQKSMDMDLQTDGNESFCTMSETSRDDEIYQVKVSNLPANWDQEVIQKFIDNECGPFDSIKVLAENSKNFNGTIKLVFESLERAEIVKNKLRNKKIDGNILNAEILAKPGDTLSATDMLEQDERLNNTYRPDLDIWTTDPKGLYGLNEQFLNSLNIKPPLYNGVHVMNFRCEKTDLLEVMKIAGNVILLNITFSTSSPKFAKVIYSHPLEAVQAVSLLHGQKLFGDTLHVVMFPCSPDDIIIPRGLQSIGPGLGNKGKPLRNLVRHFKSYVKGISSSLNKEIFQKPEEIIREFDFEEITMADVKSETSDDFPKELNEQLNIKNINDLPNPYDPSTVVNKNRNLSSSPASSISNKSSAGHSDHPNWGPSNKSVSGQTASAWSGQASSSGAISVLNRPRRAEPSGPFQQTLPRNSSVPGSSGPTYGPMPGASGPMYTPTPIQHGSMQLQGSMCGPTSQYPLQGPMGSMQWPSGPIHCPIGPMHGPNIIVQGPNGPIPGMSVPMQGPNGPMGQMHGPMVQIQGPTVPMHGPMSGPVHRPMVGPLPQGPNNPPIPGINHSNTASMPNNPELRPKFGSSGEKQLTSNVTGSVALEFFNLPLATTFTFLSDKLSQVGQMISLQLTTPGRLVVQYSLPEHAENCFRKFHRTYLGGNLVEVKYL